MYQKRHFFLILETPQVVKIEKIKCVIQVEQFYYTLPLSISSIDYQKQVPVTGKKASQPPCTLRTNLYALFVIVSKTHPLSEERGGVQKIDVGSKSEKHRFWVKKVENIDFGSKISKRSIFGRKCRTISKSRFLVKNVEKFDFW